MRSHSSGISLYVHWPFCLAKCPYCDFNSHVADTIDHPAWRRALLTALDHFAIREETGAGEKYLTSIFFGGGTPSLIDPATVAALIERAGDHWKIDANIEITLEANPTSVEAGRLTDFFAAGVNRASLGIQSLDDAALKFLGREHSAAEALKALETAKRIFPRISFDLIYGRPDETIKGWRGELSQALDLATDHLSLYQLTIEKGTPFYTRDRDIGLGLPGENSAADL
ncbi:MAG: radical SAM protein, partial [Rhodospirillaceae bacterium]|nr:radical SAM protein [Rhodospirillaceae bacterium]